MSPANTTPPAGGTQPRSTGSSGGGVPQSFRVRCREVALSAESELEQHRGLAAALVAELRVERVVLVTRHTETTQQDEGAAEARNLTGMAEVLPLAPEVPEPLDESLATLLVEVAAAACATGMPQVGRHAEGRGWYAIGASIPNSSVEGTDQQGSDVPLLAWVAMVRGDVRQLPTIAECMQCAVETFAYRGLVRRSRRGAEEGGGRGQRSGDDGAVSHGATVDESRLTAAVIDLVSRVQQCESASGARETLVRELAGYLGEGTVVLAVPGVPGGAMKVVVGSSSELSLSDVEIRQGLNWAADESVLRGDVAVWPVRDDGARHALMAHRHVSELLEERPVLSVPLVEGRREPSGVLLLVGESAHDVQTQRMFSALAGPVASCLEVWKKTEKGFLLQSLDQLGASLWRAKGIAMLAGCLLAIGAMFVPMTYHVKCDCEVQPASRRYVAAQFDGTLERSFVEPGDVVEAGDLLARLDGRELQWELSGLAADLNRAATERAGHMAVRDAGKAKIAAMEVERLELKAQLLEYRIANLELRSPVSGIVIAGDLKKSEGIPVKNGQTLFEIAPLDRVTVDVQVADDEVSHVSEQMPVAVNLEAYPERSWTGKVRRISPRSETKDRQHFFVAEVEIENAESLLRPGMEGRAYVESGEHSFGWNLFHRAWYRTLMWAGW